jgi:hypothetical protein
MALALFQSELPTGLNDDLPHPVGNNVGLQQAYTIRNLAADEAKCLRDAPALSLEDKATRAQALRNLTLVWETASERIRILRGRPLPGSLRPERKPSKRKPRSAGPVGDAAPTRARERATDSATPQPSPAISDQASDVPKPAE